MRYRQRDNGLAFLLLLSGVGVWNGMSAAQVFTSNLLTKTFFLSLAIVGALFAALGWFLFASTASSTPDTLARSSIYASIATLAGIDITLAVTTPIHSYYWTLPAIVVEPWMFAVIEPSIGYWLHTVFIASLFGAGSALFASAWRNGRSIRYTGAYTIAGSATVIFMGIGGVLFPGGASGAPLLAAMLAMIGWVQAKRGQVLLSLRTVLLSD